ncbi:unnamed protein product, partial [Rotaria sp. Silwood2]
MGGQSSKETISKSRISATTNKIASSTTVRRKRCMIENYLVIWVDKNIDLSNKEYSNISEQLRSVVNQVNCCTTVPECIQILNENNEETAFVISSGALGQHLMSNIHDMPQLHAIYIFCSNKEQHKTWAQNWTKIKGVHTSIRP